MMRWIWKWLLRKLAPNKIEIQHEIPLDIPADLVSDGKRESIRTYLNGWIRGYVGNYADMGIRYEAENLEYEIWKSKNDKSCKFVGKAVLKRKDLHTVASDDK